MKILTLIFQFIKKPRVLGCVLGVLLGFYLFNLKTQITDQKTINIQLQAILGQKNIEIAAQQALVKACVEREKEAQEAILDREKIVSSLKYQLRKEKNKEGLCNELETESRNLVIDRLNRPL